MKALFKRLWNRLFNDPVQVYTVKFNTVVKKQREMSDVSKHN